VAGGQVGFNIQRGSVVAGIETDLDSVTANGGGYTGTARGRLGLAVDRLLFYGTGGYAYAGSACTGCFADGWVAGTGVEYKLDKNWSIKGEYLHAEFTSLPTNMDSFRVGVNFFVGGGFDPLR
jgi:outer membrane immunogenic protein